MKPKLVVLISIGLLILLYACSGIHENISTEEFILTSGFNDGGLAFLGVSGGINGVFNPTLSGEPGETITVTFINGGYAEHIFAIPKLNIEAKPVSEKGDTVSVTFTLPEEPVVLDYYDTVHNHAAMGMKGTISVGSAKAQAPGAASDQGESSSAVAQVSTGPVAIIQKNGCGACHTIPGVPNAIGTIGPDLSQIGELIVERMQSGEYDGTAEDMKAYLRESILSPDTFIAPDCNGAPCLAGQMPQNFADLLTEEQVSTVVDFLASLPEGAENLDASADAGEVVLPEPPAMSEEPGQH